MSVKLDQAMIGAFRSGDFGLPVVYENDEDGDDAPAVGDKFFELRTFQNPSEPVTLNGINDVTGVLQFTLAWPLGGGAIPAKVKAQEIFDAFPSGRRVSHDGQTLVIRGHHLFKAAKNEQKGRFEVVGRINYVALVPR